MTKIYLTFFLLSASLCTASNLADAMNEQQLIQMGREGFVNRCSGCHGLNADGQGTSAPMLQPKPRNLVSGSFKFRSTSSGVLPTIEDLIRTINQGVLGTAMPPFRELSEQEKLGLALYIRSLRPEFKETKNEQTPVSLPLTPKEIFAKKATLIAAAKKGRALFSPTCSTCHGEEGRGDGPSASELTDSDNNPIRPANLRLPKIKGGKTARDVFRAITTGLDGTPMPAFENVFTESQRWDLVAYVYYLRGLEAGIYKSEKDKLQ